MIGGEDPEKDQHAQPQKEEAIMASSDRGPDLNKYP